MNHQWLIILVLLIIHSFIAVFGLSVKTERYCSEAKESKGCCYGTKFQKFGKKCHCNEDLCNTGTWGMKVSYLLMGITIGFQIVLHIIAFWSNLSISSVLWRMFIQGVLCLRCFLRLWKNNHVSRKPCKRRSDLVLNGQMRVPK